MYPSTTKEYTNYLNTNPSTFTLTEEEYYEEKEQLENRDFIERIEDKFFETLENALPKDYVHVAHWCDLFYFVSKHRVKVHLSDPKTATAVGACVIGVFFCPYLTVSSWDLYSALAFIGFMQKTRR